MSRLRLSASLIVQQPSYHILIIFQYNLIKHAQNKTGAIDNTSLNFEVTVPVKNPILNLI